MIDAIFWGMLVVFFAAGVWVVVTDVIDIVRWNREHSDK